MKRTRNSTKKKAAASQRAPIPQEPVAARVMQAAILIFAVLLLFIAISTARIGTILVGLLILVTAFPPVRGPVDEWFTGKRRGKDAQQAAALRMALGAGTVIILLLGFFTES